MMMFLTYRKVISLNNGLATLAVIMKYSSRTKHLRQKDIQALLATEYGLKVDRETIKRSIKDIIACNFPIYYKVYKRTDTDDMITDIYYKKRPDYKARGNNNDCDN